MGKNTIRSLEIIVSAMAGAILASWTTILFADFSLKGFFWVFGGCIILFILFILCFKFWGDK